MLSDFIREINSLWRVTVGKYYIVILIVNVVLLSILNLFV